MAVFLLVSIAIPEFTGSMRTDKRCQEVLSALTPQRRAMITLATTVFRPQIYSVVARMDKPLPGQEPAAAVASFDPRKPHSFYTTPAGKIIEVKDDFHANV